MSLATDRHRPPVVRYVAFKVLPEVSGSQALAQKAQNKK